MDDTDPHVLQMHFGALLKTRRDQWGIRQRELLPHLPGWTQANYSRLESGVIAPAFDQLMPIYTALQLAGIQWTPADRQQYLRLARQRIEQKKIRGALHTEADWAELRYQLASLDLLPEPPADSSTNTRVPPRPLQAETQHLLGREAWLASVLQAIQETPRKKLILLQGTMGIGKSSELHRLTRHFIHVKSPAYHIIWISLLPVERAGGPETALEVALGAILAESSLPPSPATSTLAERMAYVLVHLEKTKEPTLILLDNAEAALTEAGILPAYWEEFLAQFLRCQHSSTLVMATREWPGWPGRERTLVLETIVPPLTTQTSIQLLQQLGLERVPLEHLRAASERVGGIPLYLEWVAALAQDPLMLDDWQAFELDKNRSEEERVEAITERLTHLLADPALLRGHVASRLQPLLERIIEKRLSAESRSLLNLLAITNVPLGKPALQALCERPKPIKELRDASLLVAYTHRVQLLPMVAAAIVQRLTPEEVKALEEQVIRALKRWVDEGTIEFREAGNVIAELAMLLLKHRFLLETAELLIRYGWLSFNTGYASQLAHLAGETMDDFDWQANSYTKCGGLLLQYTLLPFLSKALNSEKRVTDFNLILDLASAGQIRLQSATELYLVHHLIFHHVNKLQFTEAQEVLNMYLTCLESFRQPHTELEASLLREQALLLARWSEYSEEQGDKQLAQSMREKTISLYRKYYSLLFNNNESTLLMNSLIKKRMGACLASLAYQLNRDERLDEALQMVEQSIDLMEQGYCNFGALAASYGEKSDILIKLGRFREASHFDEKAFAEAQRCADTGDTLSQEEIWIYIVNRGRLYLRLGRINEAEPLLKQALPHIHPRRRIYRIFAQDALNEIERWRKINAAHYQLDWRWIDRYRNLDAYDAYWWWAQAGPFSEEERQQWDQFFTTNIDEDTKEPLGKLIAQSRQRELTAAFTEHREPRLHYPALNIDEVRSRIAALLQLDTEIQQEEPHPVIRRLYHGTIEDEVAFLHLIEATYEGNCKRFLELNRLLFPDPTMEEMNYALSRLRRLLQQGLHHSETIQDSRHLLQLIHEQLHLAIDLSVGEEESPVVLMQPQESSRAKNPMISAQAAKRFFETILLERGYAGWQVAIDPKATGPRVESALRMLFIQDSDIAVDRIRHYIAHELIGHIARAIAGEHSLFGLLGINSKGYASTEEGIALYHERQLALLHGQPFDDFALWLGTLAVGLGRGVMTPPQTFSSLHSFLESLLLVYHLLLRPGRNREKARIQANKNAITRCLRVFRGVPDLEQAGICLSSDIIYLRGLWKIEQAVAEDRTILDRLATGKIALELLPEIEVLAPAKPLQSFRDLVHDPNLDAYILSFESSYGNSIS